MVRNMVQDTVDTGAMATTAVGTKGTGVMADTVEAHLTGIGASPPTLFPLRILDR
jgi:hypothetical protein